MSRVSPSAIMVRFTSTQNQHLPQRSIYRPIACMTLTDHRSRSVKVKSSTLLLTVFICLDNNHNDDDDDDQTPVGSMVVSGWSCEPTPVGSAVVCGWSCRFTSM